MRFSLHSQGEAFSGDRREKPCIMPTMSRKGTTPSSPAFVMSWLLLLMIAVSFPGWSLQGVTGWMVFAGTISLATIGAVLLVRSLWRAKTWGPVTRSLLVLSVSLVTLLSVGSAVVSWSFPQWCFDFQQRIKYPAYYAWRDGKAEFPARQFWIGFNHVTATKEYFVGKSRQQIQSIFRW